MKLIEWLQQNKYFEHFYPKMPSFIRFWNHWDHQFWMWKRAFEVYSTTDISKTVCHVVNVFPLIQSFYKWLSAEEIWKARTAYLLRKWKCKMLYVALFGFSFKFLGGQKMTFPFLDFSRLFVCPFICTRRTLITLKKEMLQFVPTFT